MQIMLIPDDGRKAETCNKFMAYDVPIQINVLTEPCARMIVHTKGKIMGKVASVHI
jgi:hypothetical protein